jgi:hypothetical protein
LSFGETRQIMADLQEIMEMLKQTSTTSEKVIRDLPKTNEALMTFRQLERIMLRYLAIANRMGLSEDAQKQIQILSKIIVTVRMLEMSMRMLSAGTPYGMLMSIAGFAMTGFAMYDAMTGV